ncbi:sugar porter family MFS transporter [Lacipirellula parvula]|uniref:D-xylose proton-symporter XylE n=1 Tax=Lacipirellula parvula TaxID=2650471 RepID=A0A5K7XDZ8_9BACT|nr:sugar porter family MFS transporter [Lacipirellula parvula]BBO31249.1 D-xylose proton-symporter XylE [Lacipirellula parvula]
MMHSSGTTGAGSGAGLLSPPGGGHDSGYLYRITMIAAIGGFLFGYDLSLISGAIIFLQKEFALTPFWTGMVTGSAILGCPFGPLCGMWLADVKGRKWSLLLAALLFMISAVGSALAPSVWQIILWRFVGGMGVGLASTVSPMYIAEISPAPLRGRMVIINQLAIVIGLSMAVVVAYFLSFGGHWRWMFFSQAIPIVGLFGGLFFVPNSPRWLAMMNRDAEALDVLNRINTPEQSEQELRAIKQELGEESGGFAELLRPGILKAVIIGLVLMVFSQINGVNMILLYTPSLFMEAGITDAPDAILNSVIIDGWITICTVIAFWLTSKFGRRPILIVGALAMGVGHLLMYANFAFQLPMQMTLLAMIVATGAFTLTLAPLSWVVVSELYPTRIRGKAMSIATCAMFTASFITVNLFPVLTNWFSAHFGSAGGTFLIFFGICLAGGLFVWKWIPETKDKTLEEIGGFWLHDSDRAERPFVENELVANPNA